MSKTVETTAMRRVRLQKEVFALVRDGYSYSQAAEMVGVSGVTAMNWCSKVGLKSPAGSRWSDFSHRAPLAKKVRGAGGTWRDVADAWAAVEGFVVTTPQAFTWTNKHAPEIVTAGKSKRPAYIRKALVAAYTGASA